MAFGDAQALVLPIGPRHMLALGQENVMITAPCLVARLNALQVHAADRYVYMHHKSGLERSQNAQHSSDRPGAHRLTGESSLLEPACRKDRLLRVRRKRSLLRPPAAFPMSAPLSRMCSYPSAR
ncbi:hypothetical protein ACFVJ4_09240 [Streptomyces sp. NPDC127178]|uniref:hypothetical protein n=1 Tax=unclassified Streptomyces TaxID=2593676 RepID=UPI00362EF652